MTSTLTTPEALSTNGLASSEPELKTYLITPERAEWLLSLNTSNRRINLNNLAKITQAMIEDRFESFNGATIVVSKSGVILDGQHRLQAVVKSGKSVLLPMMIGVNDSVAPTIDQGLPRSVANILHIGGVDISNIHEISATARTLLKLDPRLPSAEDKTLVAAYIQEHLDELNEWVTFGVALSKVSPSMVLVSSKNAKKTRSITSSVVSALLVHMAREGADPDTLKGFFYGAARGFDLPPETIQQLSEAQLTTLQTLHRRLAAGQNTLARAGGGGFAKVLTEYAIYITAYSRYINSIPVQQAKAPKVAPADFAALPAVSTGRVFVKVYRGDEEK